MKPLVTIGIMVVYNTTIIQFLPFPLSTLVEDILLLAIIVFGVQWCMTHMPKLPPDDTMDDDQFDDPGHVYGTWSHNTFIER